MVMNMMFFEKVCNLECCVKRWKIYKVRGGFKTTVMD